MHDASSACEPATCSIKSRHGALTCLVAHEQRRAAMLLTCTAQSYAPGSSRLGLHLAPLRRALWPAEGQQVGLQPQVPG